MSEEVVIQVSPRTNACQVEGFPPKATRSQAGALHLKPGATLVITEDELKHLEATRPGACRVTARPAQLAARKKALSAKAALVPVVSAEPPPAPEKSKKKTGK